MYVVYNYNRLCDMVRSLNMIHDMRDKMNDGPHSLNYTNVPDVIFVPYGAMLFTKS
jgi:hypothetical protein